MIKTLIFDFGDVFINLDKEGTIQKSIQLLGKDIITEAKRSNNQDLFKINDAYEKGKISTQQFLTFYKGLAHNINESDIIFLWNSLIKDFPLHRLKFIENITNTTPFKTILLSNTNELHINYIKENVSFYDTFKSCFDAFYLSYEMGLRKPDNEIFQYVLTENNLNAKECLFIDDTKENTIAASKLGINIWNINPKKEDVTELFTLKQELF